MTNYILRINEIVNQFVYALNYVSNHLSSYPGVIILVSLWVFIFIVSALKKLCS